MSKQAYKKTATDRLKERLEQQEKKMEELKGELEEKEREFQERLTEEIEARCAVRDKTLLVEGMDVGGEVGVISEMSSKSRATYIEQEQLIPAQKVNCHIYCYTVLYPAVKFIDDETFRESPRILEDVMKKMGIETEIGRQQHLEDTKREIKHCLVHRRSYCKDQNARKYKGTKLIVFCAELTNCDNFSSG